MQNTTSSYHLKLVRALSLLALVALLGSCSNMRYLEDGQQLYTGSKVILESDEKIDNKNEIISELEGVIRPQPNERFLIWRPRLWFYNIAGESPQRGLRKWMKNRIGRPPVLWEQFDGQRSQRLIENRLFNRGFFDAQVEFIPIEKEKRAKAEFRVLLPQPYTIDEIFPLDAEGEIATPINASLENTRLRQGQSYQLSRLRSERQRISRDLRDEGYFFFNPDFLVFRADTTIGDRRVNLALALSPGIPANAKKQFTIRNIYIHAEHSLDSDRSGAPADTLYLGEGYYIISNNGLFKTSTLQRAVFFEKGKIYNTQDHDLTINHLMGLNVFKFVNVRFTEVSDNDTPQMDVNVFLTPMEKKSLGVEVRGVSKSNDFAGPGLTASFTNRNFLRGAEQFSLNLDGAYEMLLGRSETRRASSTELGITSELTIPRFVAPFGIGEIYPFFVPRTRIVLGLNYLNRTDAFSVYSIRSQFGYQWNQSVALQHRFNPFVFNIFTLGTIAPEYEDFFTQEVLLRRGLFEQFLLGSEYSFYYNSQLKGRRKHAWYFNYNIDLSGNTLYLLFDGLGLGEKQDDGGYGILNQSFSQYTKTDFDLRYYLDMGHGQRIASRLIAGVGIPYGNSTTLPYVKLFTIGGSNSIRAFQPRSLGPGAYNPPDTMMTTFNIYQSGEIKLELNVEYRFDLSNIVKGALFADAGNIWNLEEREGAPGGQFKSSEFLNQIALGTGAGLRFDFTFLILRLDLAFPLAVPFDDSPGYFQPIRPLERSWRRDNLVLSFAIGYPF